jgi:hypothetical protein
MASFESHQPTRSRKIGKAIDERLVVSSLSLALKIAD